MAAQFTRSYTSDHTVNDDGTVDFACSTKVDDWAWLALPPRHPVVIQAQNFWTSVGAIMALGGMEEGQWSALTWTDWECFEAQTGHATRGTYWRDTSGEQERYGIDLFDASSRHIVRMHGRGVVFRNRNFEEWRKGSKREAARQSDTPIAFAARDALGIGPTVHALVGEAVSDGHFPALVSRENGLPPANPMLGGSGDHVNSVHMIEAARQALCLLTDDPAPAITGGEMALNRYVELGTPFALRTSGQEGGEVTFILEQLGRDCAELTLRR